MVDNTDDIIRRQVAREEAAAAALIGAIPCPGDHARNVTPLPAELDKETSDLLEEWLVDLLSDPRNRIRCDECGAWL